MAVNSFVSPLTILNKFKRDFKPSDNNWIGSFFEWIADVILLTNVPTMYANKHKVVEIKNGRANLPVNAEIIDYIEYANYYLPKAGGHRMMNRENRICHPSAKYQLDGNCIQTTFDCGDITIYYKGLAEDPNGLPLVPSNVKFQEAACWYILERCLLQGMQHHLFNYGDVKIISEQKLYEARNNLKMGTVEDEIAFKAMWVNYSITPNEVARWT